MNVASVSASAITSVKPPTGQAVAQQQVAASDADGDSDGSSAAQAAAEARGGIDVKG